MKTYAITNQRALRSTFWEQNPGLSRKKHTCGSERIYSTDTRVAFVEWIDHLCRSGDISTALAQRATLE